ncbi:Histone-lysine N-methyltransferase SETMAR [Ooceraea biroi]|uniref:Histone-lysine N-methyltransferase SETMAR n=3 Tax=Ooceraea biroi TaxID=2015173 RepID=A0A026VYM5_OOCBI|nr:Histone-lysine N-methyltransferase SETMAR [Ooceraea biroi]
MEKSKIRVIYEYEFRRGTTVSETARNINAVFGEGSTTKATVGNWFKNFRDGDFSLANEPRRRPKTKVDNDHSRAVVESDPSQSTRELASIFNVSIPTYLYCKQLDEMIQQLAIKQPKLVNRSMPILLHDNARPHTARLTVAKLQELELETLRHPPYSPDLSPTDYHFFRNLDNFLVGKFFNSQQAVETAFRDFIDSRTPGFYSRGIDQLPLKWQKCVDNMGAYFD